MIDEPIRKIDELVKFIHNQLGVEISVSTCASYLKACGFSWRRARRSLKHKRNQDAFDIARKKIQEMEKDPSIEVFFFDEAGLNLTPSVPYMWQKKGEREELPSSSSLNLTTLGFMSKQDFYSFTLEGAATSDVVIECFNEFMKMKKSKHVVVILDNASTHRSNAFCDMIEQWEEAGVEIYFIPPYSPELNHIERLWKEIKYSWLPLKSYMNKQTLRVELEKVLLKISNRELAIKWCAP